MVDYIFFISIFNFQIFGYNSAYNLFNLLWVFVLFPNYITHIIQNIDKLNLFDASYFWNDVNFGLGNWLFLLFTGLYFSFILTLMWSDKKRIKDIILKFHFGFFTIALIFRVIHIYLRNPQDSNVTITIGSKNLVVLLSDIITIATYIYILTRIKQEVDSEFLKNTIKKYIFTISELLLALFVALTFYHYVLSPDANKIDYISYVLEFLLFGFFIFLLIQLLRIRFKEG